MFLYEFPDNVASKGLRMNDTPPMKSWTSSKVAERPKVSFGPYVEKHTADRGLPNQKVSFKQIRHEAKGHFTPNPGKIYIFIFIVYLKTAIYCGISSLPCKCL